MVATDSCLEGAGGTFGKRYFRFSFPEKLKGSVGGINQLEAIAIIVALKLWGPCLAGRKFKVKCDNMTTVSVVNTGRAKEEFLQACAREIVFLACIYNFEIRADHIPGVTNILPDLLSRAAINTKYFHQFQSHIDDSWQEDCVPASFCEFSCSW